MFCTILFPIIYKSIFNFLQSSMLSFYSIAYWTNNTNRSVIVIIKHFIPFVLKINWIGNCFKSWSKVVNNFIWFLTFFVWLFNKMVCFSFRYILISYICFFFICFFNFLCDYSTKCFCLLFGIFNFFDLFFVPFLYCFLCWFDCLPLLYHYLTHYFHTNSDTNQLTDYHQLTLYHSIVLTLD